MARVKCVDVKRVGKWKAWLWGLDGDRELEIYINGVPHGFNIEVGQTYDVDLQLIPHVVSEINMNDKMFMKISTYPYYPTYICMGAVKSTGTDSKSFTLDCGYLMKISKPHVKNIDLRDGMYLAIMGFMFGEFR